MSGCNCCERAVPFLLHRSAALQCARLCATVCTAVHEHLNRPRAPPDLSICEPPIALCIRPIGTSSSPWERHGQVLSDTCLDGIGQGRRAVDGHAAVNRATRVPTCAARASINSAPKYLQRRAQRGIEHLSAWVGEGGGEM